MLNDRWVESDKICFYAAASSIGYVAVFGTKWFAGKWPVSWKKFHITLMELYPTVAAVETWGHHLRNHCILFFSDKQAVVEIINKLSSKESNIMNLVHRLTLTAMKFNFLFRAKHIPKHIPGVHNITAQFYPVFSSKRQRDMLHGFWKQPW